jgi:hypothetical protein
MKCMVVKTQEAKDALESYIKEFDSTKFPGENVPSACLCLYAVAAALGNNDLPQNFIKKTSKGLPNYLPSPSTMYALARLYHKTQNWVVLN